MTRLDELVRTWKCPGGSAPPAELRNQIAGAAREIALRSARSFRLSTAEQEDIAQQISDRFVQRLLDGPQPVERAEALVWRMAENRARDVFRATTRRRNAFDRFATETASLPPAPDPETLWLDRERAQRAAHIVREALTQAPENYRVAIQRHWLEGEPVESLAEEYYRELRASAGQAPADDAVLRKKARNRVDQHLKRGRDWLRKRLAEHLQQKDGR